MLTMLADDWENLGKAWGTTCFHVEDIQGRKE